jgi:acyl carrier protein
MTDEQIKDAIISIIRDIAPDEDPSGLDPAVRLRDQMDLDSMDFLDIVMELRKRYGVHVPDTDYQQLATLDSCVEYLRDKMAGKQLAA